jgi:hypothetical protein
VPNPTAWDHRLIASNVKTSDGKYTFKVDSTVAAFGAGKYKVDLFGANGGLLTQSPSFDVTGSAAAGSGSGATTTTAAPAATTATSTPAASSTSAAEQAAGAGTTQCPPKRRSRLYGRDTRFQRRDLERE